MALHKKNFPGPKNFVTKKYPTKFHNPSHLDVISLNQRRSGASAGGSPHVHERTHHGPIDKPFGGGSQPGRRGRNSV